VHGAVLAFGGRNLCLILAFGDIFHAAIVPKILGHLLSNPIIAILRVQSNCSMLQKADPICPVPKMWAAGDLRAYRKNIQANNGNAAINVAITVRFVTAFLANSPYKYFKPNPVKIKPKNKLTIAINADPIPSGPEDIGSRITDLQLK
jgi:hypothetical protein